MAPHRGTYTACTCYCRYFLWIYTCCRQYWQYHKYTYCQYNSKHNGTYSFYVFFIIIFLFFFRKLVLCFLFFIKICRICKAFHSQASRRLYRPVVRLINSTVSMVCRLIREIKAGLPALSMVTAPSIGSLKKTDFSEILLHLPLETVISPLGFLTAIEYYCTGNRYIYGTAILFITAFT